MSFIYGVDGNKNNKSVISGSDEAVRVDNRRKMGRIAAPFRRLLFASVHLPSIKKADQPVALPSFSEETLLLGLTTSVPAFYCLRILRRIGQITQLQAGDRGSGTTLPLMAHAFHVISGRCLPPGKRPPRHRAGRSVGLLAWQFR